MNRIGKKPSLDLPAVTFIVMAAAALLLVVSYDGGVFSGPDSCQQPQAIRDALENATGLACAEIGSADLRDIRVLDLRGIRHGPGYSDTFSYPLRKLQPGAFNGLERLELLDLSANGLTELPPGVFDGLENLRVLDLSFQHIGGDLAWGKARKELDPLTKLELPHDVFENLTNLEALYLEGSPLTTIIFTITHPNADLVCWGCVVVPP